MPLILVLTFSLFCLLFNVATLMHLDTGTVMGDHAQKFTGDSDMNIKNSFWKKNIRNLPGRYYILSKLLLVYIIFKLYKLYINICTIYVLEQVLKRKANPFLLQRQLHLMIFKRVLVMHGKLELKMKYYLYQVNIKWHHF